MERVTAATQAATAAAERIEQAGVNATPAMHADLGRKRMIANRLRRAAETGAAPTALVTLVRYKAAAPETDGSDRSDAKLHAARLALATGMHMSDGFGTSAPALADSVGLDVHAITAARCHELLEEEAAAATDAAHGAMSEDETETLVRTQKAEAVSQQLRINALVKAISTDLKWELAQIAEAFKQRTVVQVAQ